jgi:hypothetical protein
MDGWMDGSQGRRTGKQGGGNYAIRNFIICTPLLIEFGYRNKEIV